MLTPRSNNPEL